MVDNKREAAESTREGGRDEPEARSVGLSGVAAKPRNSSGSASVAASLLDLRQKLNFVLEELGNVASSLGDADMLARVKAYRQQGFRSNRGPRG